LKKLQPETIKYPPLSADLSGGWMRLLRVFGPGAIIASVTVGTGETIFAPRLGAVFGYAMLWVVLTAVVFKAVQVYAGARYIVLTGEHPLRAWSRIPGPRAWVTKLLGIVSILAFPMWVAALSDALGSLCIWITGIGVGSSWARPLWATAIILTATTLTLIQTYNIVEGISTFILVLKMGLIILAILLVKPDWAAALWGMVVPHVPAYEPWVIAKYPEFTGRTVVLEMAVLLGAVGGGVQDYLGYVGFLREKNWGASGQASDGPARLACEPGVVARGLSWLRAPALDVTVSFGSVFLITICFMILGAAVLHPLRLVPTDADLYSQQSQFLGLIHPQLITVYKAGVFFAIFGAIYGMFPVYARTTYELATAIWPRRGWNFDKLRLRVILYSAGGGLLLLWTGFKTVVLASIVAPFAGVLGCGLWCLAMIWVERKHLPPVYRMSTWLLALISMAGITMTALGCYVTALTWWH
jgi:Mn2+/Fe2+ NRAMP family transporter